jgi:N12 class adenine-specific DNA methylase
MLDRSTNNSQDNNVHITDTEILLPSNQVLLSQDIDLKQLPSHNNYNEIDIVDKYARLVEEKRTIERELELLKEEIVRLSKDRNTETLAGKIAVLKVKVTTEIKFPLAKDPQRQVLEHVLKENDKWLDVSSLSISMLSKALKSNNWSGSLRERVLQFSHVEESSRVTVQKLET